MKKFFIQCWTFIVPLILVVIATIITKIKVGQTQAELVSNFGSLTVVVFNVLYIVFMPWLIRLKQLLTFRRFTDKQCPVCGKYVENVLNHAESKSDPKHTVLIIHSR
jgi:uncharacterized membrane protein YGL010W